MKRTYKILAMLLCIVMVTTTLASCNLSEIISGIVNPGVETPDTPDDPITKPHYCESKCPKCGKCLDKSCTEITCANKCAGHTVTPNHQCDSFCPECGKCTDTTCTDAVCTAKCEGHVPPHTCESKCDNCGKCTDSECTEDACKSKCQGHAEGPANPAAYSYMPQITEEMPAIYINTPDGSNEWVTKYNRNDKINGLIKYEKATVSTGNCDDGYVMTDVAAEVKVRGNYTLEYVKKPIRIKFSSKNNLLGLHDGEKYKNWVLLADWKDLSMMNNSLAFFLGNNILGADGLYCTDFRNVEVYLNGQYWGVYLLVEQQEVKDDRTSVPEVEKNYTGNDIGYFFEYDGYYYLETEANGGDPTFTMTYPSGANYRSDIGYTIKSDIYADSQIAFLRNYMNNAYYIAFEATKGNYCRFDENYNVVAYPEATSAKQVVSQVINVQSLVDMYIINELACDLDVDWSSMYLSLDMSAEGDKRVTFEAPWDWDSCFGLRSGIVNDAQGLYAANKQNPWFNLLKNESWYQDMIREKWSEMKKYDLLEKTIEFLELEKETYKNYYINNYNRWSERVYQGNGECNSTLNSYKDINTAQGLAADFLIDWITKRFAYLDSIWYVYEYEAAFPEAYDPAPIIREEMAAIYINTPSDTANTWATKFNKNTKKDVKYVKATISVGNCEEEYVMTDVAAEVKVRGNATLNYEKKPIRIKFEKKQKLLGLHDDEKYKSWVLLADYKDLSMMNNSLAFYLGNAILGSDGYYCTDFRNVEVYLNGQYWGVYLLVEQQEVKDNRSSVPEVDDDYTGTDIGYFFEYDGYYYEEGTSKLDGGDGDPTFTMSYPSGAAYRSGIGYTVKSDLYTKDQLNFLKSYLEKAFTIAYEATKGNYYKFDENYNIVADSSAKNAKDVVASVIDIQSLVDIYILNEIACDLDVDWSSFYLSLNMTAEGNKKITFEAPWDWDSCFGLRSDINNAVPNAQGMYASKKNNPWIRLVTNEDWFWEMVVAKWTDMKDHGVLENTIEFLKAEKETYKDYYIKNFERWPNRVIDGNSECNSTLQSYRDPKTAQSLAADWVIDWITKRFAYLDKQWGDGAFGSIKVDENLPEGAVAYRFEAEHAALANFTDSAPIRNNRDYASGNAYVGGTIGGATITFTINASEATTAYLFAAVSKMSYAASFDTWFSITVNGEEILLPTRNVDSISGGEEAWHTFVNVKLLPIELKKGENTIVFNCLPERNNLDYIELYSAVELN